MVFSVGSLAEMISEHPDHAHAVAIGLIRGAMKTYDAPLQKLQHIQNILIALEQVTAV